MATQARRQAASHEARTEEIAARASLAVIFRGGSSLMAAIEEAASRKVSAAHVIHCEAQAVQFDEDVRVLEHAIAVQKSWFEFTAIEIQCWWRRQLEIRKARK